MASGITYAIRKPIPFDERSVMVFDCGCNLHKITQFKNVVKD